MFGVYLDGVLMRTFETEAEASAWCAMYDGDKEATYEPYVEG